MDDGRVKMEINRQAGEPKYPRHLNSSSQEGEQETSVVMDVHVSKKRRKSRPLQCRKCRNHGRIEAVKFHKDVCPFRFCSCKNCKQFERPALRRSTRHQTESAEERLGTDVHDDATESGDLVNTRSSPNRENTTMRRQQIKNALCLLMTKYAMPDDPWVQFFVYALLKESKFNTTTVKSKLRQAQKEVCALMITESSLQASAETTPPNVQTPLPQIPSNILPKPVVSPNASSPFVVSHAPTGYFTRYTQYHSSTPAFHSHRYATFTSMQPTPNLIASSSGQFLPSEMNLRSVFSPFSPLNPAPPPVIQPGTVSTNYQVYTDKTQDPQKVDGVLIIDTPCSRPQQNGLPVSSAK